MVAECFYYWYLLVNKGCILIYTHVFYAQREHWFCWQYFRLEFYLATTHDQFGNETSRTHQPILELSLTPRLRQVIPMNARRIRCSSRPTSKEDPHGLRVDIYLACFDIIAWSAYATKALFGNWRRRTDSADRPLGVVFVK